MRRKAGKVGVNVMGVDAQGRVCLPGGFRKEFGFVDSSSVAHLCLDPVDRMLMFADREAISAYAHRVTKDIPGMREADLIEFLFFSRITVTVDSRGRFAIPEPMRDATGITESAWIVATDHYLVIESSQRALDRHALLRERLKTQAEGP